MMGKFKIYHGGSPLWKLLIALSPLSIACFIAISRTLDYHHNFSDILGGCVLGIFIAPFVYFLNYPSLFSSHCYLPFNRYFTSYTKVDQAPVNSVSPNSIILTAPNKQPSASYRRNNTSSQDLEL